MNGLQQLRQELCSVPSLVDPPLPTHEALAGLSECTAACAQGGCGTQGRSYPGVNQISAQAIRTF